MAMPWGDQIERMAAEAAPQVGQQVYQLAEEHDLLDTAVAMLVREAFARLELPSLPVDPGLLGGALNMLGGLMQTPVGAAASNQLVDLLAESSAANTLRDAALDGVKRYLDDNSGRLLNIVVQAAAARLTNQST